MNSQHTCLRLHPAFSAKAKRLWLGLPNLEQTEPSESLGQCLAKADLVVTFSIDALIASVRQKRPTICCIPEKYYVPEWHGFLHEIPGITVAYNSAMLDAQLSCLTTKGCNGKPEFSPTELKKLDYTFGSLDTVKNLSSLFNNLLTDRNNIQLSITPLNS